MSPSGEGQQGSIGRVRPLGLVHAESDVGKRKSDLTLIELVVIVAVAACSAFLLSARFSNAGRLKAHLKSYLHSATNEPIDSHDNDQVMVRIMRGMDPLTSDRDIEAVLDILLDYDATDNQASGVAEELLAKYKDATLTHVRRRDKLLHDPEHYRCSRLHYLLARMGEKPAADKSKDGNANEPLSEPICPP